MIATGRVYIFRAWWVVTFPGLAISILVLGCNLLGDGLGEILDPRQRRAL
jgi:ABC-type dipeptide/oligopeptide/nickel transport system permease subunit